MPAENPARPARRAFAALTAAAALAAALPALAQSPRSFAVVSELAREVSVVTYQPAVGSILNNNAVSRIPMPQGMLDKFVLNHTRAVLAQEAPGSRVFLVSPLDADLFGNMQSASVGTRVEIPADVAEAFKSQGSTHLLLFSRHRSEAALRFKDGRGGSGSLEGLGFYIDRTVTVSSDADRQSGRGFIAPYLHARITLVDLATGRVQRTVEVRESSTFANVRADAKTMDVWDALSPNDKVRALLELLDQEISKNLKTLLAPA